MPSSRVNTGVADTIGTTATTSPMASALLRNCTERALATPAAKNHRFPAPEPDTGAPSRRNRKTAVASDTLLPTSTANDGLLTSMRPYLVAMWPIALMSDAPSGRTMAHSGQLRLRPFGFHAAATAPATTAPVPIAIGSVSRSPSTAMANMAPKIGVAEVSELVSVGPISLMLEMTSVVDSAGRMMPTAANSRAALVHQYQPCR